MSERYETSRPITKQELIESGMHLKDVNAGLIAALKEIERWANPGTRPVTVSLQEVCQRIGREARAAIAKATGEQS